MRGLSAVPVAARYAAATLTPSIEQAAGIGVLGRSRTSVFYPEEDEEPTEEEERSRLAKIFNWVTQHGIPAWKRRAIKRRARDVRILAPDIAVLRSVSLMGKMQMQWAREEREMLKREMTYIGGDDERKHWMKQMGIKYW